MENMVRMVVLVIVEVDIFTFTKKMGFCRNLPTRNLGLWSMFPVNVVDDEYQKSSLLPFYNDS